MEINIYQQVFLLFYAIFWGAVASVQPRWKAFQWPLVFKVSYARHRVVLSLIVMNILPLIFFGYVLNTLSGVSSHLYYISITSLIVRGVIPAFAILGFYRLWLGIVELFPNYYYAEDTSKINEEKYHHIEPTYRISLDNRQQPFVDLGSDTGCCNILFAVIYLVIAGITPWLQL